MEDDFRALLEAMRAEIAEMRRDSDAQHEATRRELEGLRRNSDAQHEATRREVERLHLHFDFVGEDLSGRIGALAEAVLLLDGKVDRHVARLDDRLDFSFAETHALIRFSHAQPDSRLSAFE